MKSFFGTHDGRLRGLRLAACCYAFNPLLTLFSDPGAAAAQTFEVASVRPAARDARITAKRGGPGTKDPTRLVIENYPLISIVAEAYNLKFYQLTYPEWMFFTRFNIAANVAAGATKGD